METVKCKLTKEEFENILARLDNLANSIEILTVEVLSNKLFDMSKARVKKSLLLLSELQSQMDIAKTDFYHILGMTNLSAAQVVRLTMKFKRLIELRNSLKSSMNALTSYQFLLGQINARKGSYSLKVLGDKELKIKEKTEVNENDSDAL